MAKPLVLRSIETEDELRCVDVFRRDDGSFGFEEYRRDPEDGRGWQIAGGYGGQCYATQDQALDGAIACVRWLHGASLDNQS